MANITALERKMTSTNKPYMSCSLEDGRKVSVWSDHPLYGEVAIGFEIPDSLLYQKGQYWNLSDPSRGARKGAVTRADNKRTEQIKEAQDRKETSIAFFNATNSAIALVNHYGTNTPDEMKQEIRMWRDWFLAEHDAYKGHKERYPVADPLKEEPKAEPEEGHGPIDW